jgi:hypothetical protein
MPSVCEEQRNDAGSEEVADPTTIEDRRWDGLRFAAVLSFLSRTRTSF